MDLKNYLDELRRVGLLKMINSPMSMEFDIPLVVHRFSGSGPALLFNNVKSHPGFSAVANIIDTRVKLTMALRVSSIEEAYIRLLNAEANPLEPREINDFPLIRLSEVDLSKLPIPRFFEKEPGPCLTSGVVLGLGEYVNASFHRLTVIDKDKFVIRLVPRHLYRIFNDNKAKGLDTPIAIVWGIHPAFLLASASSPPYGVSELGVANRLMNGELRVFKLSNGIPVPVDAEVVMEGFILKDVEHDEGPCVDVMGTYDVVRRQPVVKITAVYVKPNPIVHVLVAGDAENSVLMGFEKEAKIWSAVRAVADVKAVRLTKGGGGWLHAVVSIRKTVEGEGKNAILAAFAAHPSLKHVVVVDDDVNVDDLNEVEWAIATRFRADEDLVIIEGVRGSSLDPAAINQSIGLTTKMGIDATRPLSKDAWRFERAKIPERINVNEIKLE
ncbi:MAG: UbiD family decarboxylase [Caldivirga sp.]|uniref:UbiD family decarboxylase n=1 Tax=Caldivirga sp. TaxID=2080243 RepID=UPI003D0FE89C